MGAFAYPIVDRTNQCAFLRMTSGVLPALTVFSSCMAACKIEFSTAKTRTICDTVSFGSLLVIAKNKSGLYGATPFGNWGGT